MSNNPVRLLVDTNVWLDNFIPGRAGHSSAAAFFSYARSHGMQLLYPIESLKDVFYLINAHFKADIRAIGREIGSVESAVARSLAWDCVNNMRDIGCAVGADEADAWLAVKYRSLHDDLEDGLVLAAAQRAQADYLVTNDQALVKKSPVPTMTPQDWVALQQSQ